MVSLVIFAWALCRIRACITSFNKTKLNVDDTMICLTWGLLALSAIVQASLMTFYAIGVAYQDNETFKNYTNVMMYINTACTCGAQVILSFVFSQMSEPL